MDLSFVLELCLDLLTWNAIAAFLEKCVAKLPWSVVTLHHLILLYHNVAATSSTCVDRNGPLRELNQLSTQQKQKIYIDIHACV